MPRFIDSDIGGRTITIPDSLDGFEAGVAPLPDGTTASLKWVAANAPDGKAFFHDRVSAGDAYKLYPGVAWSMVVWIYLPGGVPLSVEHLIGLNQQNIASLEPYPNWAIERVSGNFRFIVRDTYAGVNFPNNFTVVLSGTQTEDTWHMAVATHDPASVGSELKTYWNGVFRSSAAVTGGSFTIFDPTGTDYELCVNHKANLALSSFVPASAEATNIEIAKLAVFQGKALTPAEIADLYVAMNP